MKLLTLVGLADVGIAVDGVLDGVFRGERWSEQESEIMDWNNTYDNGIEAAYTCWLGRCRHRS